MKHISFLQAWGRSSCNGFKKDCVYLWSVAERHHMERRDLEQEMHLLPKRKTFLSENSLLGRWGGAQAFLITLPELDKRQTGESYFRINLAD